MKQAFYSLHIVVPTEQDLEEFGEDLWPIVEVQLEVREEMPGGQIHLGHYPLPLLHGGEEPEEGYC